MLSRVERARPTLLSFAFETSGCRSLVFGCERRRCWAAAWVKEALFLPGGTGTTEGGALAEGFPPGETDPDNNGAFTLQANFKSARGRSECGGQAHEVLRGGARASRPMRIIGFWQHGQSGGAGVGRSKGGAFQSNNAWMRSHLVLAAALHQPK